jgi:hypothetical protein
MTPLNFLNLLWQFKPAEMYVLIWTLPDKCSYWYRDVAAAAEFVLKARGLDVYVGVGLSKADCGPTHRCMSDEVTRRANLSSRGALRFVRDGRVSVSAAVWTGS